MIRKVLIFFILAFALLGIAEFYGVIHITVLDEKPRALQFRDEFVLKSSVIIDSNSF